MVLVDASVWIDYFGGAETPEALWLDRQMTSIRLGLTDLTLCEVLQGIRSETQVAKVRRHLLSLAFCSTGGLNLALTAAENFRTLRSRGITVRKTIDCWIATYCIQQKLPLLHRDRDFEPFAKYLGLVTIDPAMA
jgi:predicted nucleic acid-binding protein